MQLRLNSPRKPLFVLITPSEREEGTKPLAVSVDSLEVDVDPVLQGLVVTAGRGRRHSCVGLRQEELYNELIKTRKK